MGSNFQLNTQKGERYSTVSLTIALRYSLSRKNESPSSTCTKKQSMITTSMNSSNIENSRTLWNGKVKKNKKIKI